MILPYYKRLFVLKFPWSSFIFIILLFLCKYCLCDICFLIKRCETLCPFNNLFPLSYAPVIADWPLIFFQFSNTSGSLLISFIHNVHALFFYPIYPHLPESFFHSTFLSACFHSKVNIYLLLIMFHNIRATNNFKWHDL